jgi:hypothetical protein
MASVVADMSVSLDGFVADPSDGVGDGIRMFGPLATAPVELGNPAVSEGNGVTHLYYDVIRQQT